MKKTKEPFNQNKYIAEFKRKTYKHIDILLNKTTDKDIIDFLSSLPNKSEYVKELIRKDMEGK